MERNFAVVFIVLILRKVDTIYVRYVRLVLKPELVKPHVISSHLADIQSIVEMYRSSKDQEANENNTLLNYAGFVGQRMSPAGTQLFSCLEYCILEDAPLSCFGKPMMRKYCKIQYCCEKTLRKNFLRYRSQ